MTNNDISFVNIPCNENYLCTKFYHTETLKSIKFLKKAFSHPTNIHLYMSIIFF